MNNQATGFQTNKIGRFLLGRWRPTAWWFSLAVMARNLLVALTPVLYAGDGGMQLAASVMTNPDIRANSTRVANELRSENGVRNGIEFIEEVVKSFPYPWTIRLPRFHVHTH